MTRATEIRVSLVITPFLEHGDLDAPSGAYRTTERIIDFLVDTLKRQSQFTKLQTEIEYDAK